MSIFSTPPNPRAFKRIVDAYNRTKGRCVYCNEKVWIRGYHADTPSAGFPKTKLATSEHIIPKSKGGTYNQKNITCSCLQCNSARAAISHHDFLLIRQRKNWRTIAKQAIRDDFKVKPIWVKSDSLIPKPHITEKFTPIYALLPKGVSIQTVKKSNRPKTNGILRHLYDTQQKQCFYCNQPLTLVHAQPCKPTHAILLRKDKKTKRVEENLICCCNECGNHRQNIKHVDFMLIRTQPNWKQLASTVRQNENVLTADMLKTHCENVTRKSQIIII